MAKAPAKSKRVTRYYRCESCGQTFSTFYELAALPICTKHDDPEKFPMVQVTSFDVKSS